MSGKRIWQSIGIAGTLGCLLFFIHNPSWPTPDKLLIFLTFVFMAISQAKALLGRLLPFVVLLLVYESFRGIATQLNHRVNFLWMPYMDKLMFGKLPTATLQRWWWHGHVQWYDFLFYGVYMMHFVLPIALAILVWKTRAAYYWRVISSYVVLSFAGFLTYLVFPAAPPWMASDQGYIERITHVSSYVWSALGFHNFNIAYSKIAPNPVAAVPSLHAAYSTLFVIFIFKLYGKKWGAVSLIYPFLIVTGTIYMGEHYAIDAVLGILYAVTSFTFVMWAYPKVVPWFKSQLKKLRRAEQGHAKDH